MGKLKREKIARKKAGIKRAPATGEVNVSPIGRRRYFERLVKSPFAFPLGIIPFFTPQREQSLG